MKKEGKKGIQEVDISTAAQTSSSQPEKKYIIEKGDEYPNRLIGYVKIRIEAEKLDEEYNKTGQFQQKCNYKGTCCMIAPNYILTAGHNVYAGYKLPENFENIKTAWKDTSYVKQGLGLKKQGGQSFIAQYSITDYFINPLYNIDIQQTEDLKNQAKRQVKQASSKKEESKQQLQKRVSQKLQELKKQMKNMQDFALLKVKPLAEPIKEKYMPIVVISEQTFKKKITNISVFGYPVSFNQQKSPEEKKSSVYINNLCGNCSNWKSYERNCINYDLITEGGISGAPIIAELDGRHIIIAIHKGGGEQDNRYNVGVGAGQMIEGLNEFGYRQEKKPFVFTEKTLYLHDRDTEIESREILFLMDKGLGPIDMLVFTSYHLSNVQKILLSGNEIGDKGVEFLLRRKYPKLHALFLTQNKIGDLSAIPEENWKNVEQLTVLGLSVNELTDIPKGFLHLKNLQKLWLNHNNIKNISKNLIDLCKQINRESFTVYLHTNSINLENQKELIDKLTKQLKTRIVWDKQGVKA